MSVIILKDVDISTLANDALKNTLGESATIIPENLSGGIVDSGVAIANANAYRNFLDNLLVATSKYIFRFRAYESKAPNVLRDNSEYGRLIQKIRSKMPPARKNQSWDLQDNTSYDDNIFRANEIEVKIFKDRVAFEIQKSITNDQIKDAFTNATELGNFVSMVFGEVQNRLTVDLDNLIFYAINNYMGELIHNTKQIKLLTMFKAEVDPASTLTSDDCIYDSKFLTYASSVINEYKSLMGRYSELFNLESYPTFTPDSMLHVLLLSKFRQAIEMFAQSSTFHDEYIKLPYGEETPFWMNVGDMSLKDKSSIDITTSEGHTVKASYIVAFMFDHDALGVNHNNPSVETKYIRSGQFTNYWYKEDLGVFNDFAENALVFTLE